MAIYIANKYFDAFAWAGAKDFFHGYLNDFLGEIVFLAISNMLAWIVRAPIRFRTFSWIATLFIASSCVWEFVTPIYKNGSIMDPLDFVAYFLAACLFYLLCRTLLPRTS